MVVRLTMPAPPARSRWSAGQGGSPLSTQRQNCARRRRSAAGRFRLRRTRLFGPTPGVKYHEDARLSRDDETHKNLPAIRCAMSRGSARHHRSSPQGPLGRNGSGVAKTRRGGKGTEEQTGQSRSRDRPRRLTPQSFRDFICSKSRFTQWPSAKKTPRPSGGGASWGCEVWGT
jgi:hypothetical protein